MKAVEKKEPFNLIDAIEGRGAWKGNKLQPTHLLAVDMVIACIYKNRLYCRDVAIAIAKGGDYPAPKALKSLKLRPGLYKEFKNWVEKELGEAAIYDDLTGKFRQLEFDGVNVDRGSHVQSEKMIMEFYA